MKIVLHIHSAFFKKNTGDERIYVQTVKQHHNKGRGNGGYIGVYPWRKYLSVQNPHPRPQPNQMCVRCKRSGQKGE